MMMFKRLMICFVLLAVMAAGAPVVAGTISEAAVAQLRTKGYNNITVRRTLLGRIRIIATTDETRREIVIHPLTGQILRDKLVTKDGARITKTPERIDLSGAGNDDAADNDTDGGDGSADGDSDGDGDADSGGDGDGDSGGDGDGDSGGDGDGDSGGDGDGDSGGDGDGDSDGDGGGDGDGDGDGGDD